MPRRRIHAVAGGGAGLIAGLATMPNAPDVPDAENAAAAAEKSRAIHLGAAVIGGVIGGIAPDVLEPAVSPRHRGALHSIAAGGALGVAAFSKWHADCLALAAACERRYAVLPVESAEYRNERFNAMLWRVAAALIIGFCAGYASHLVLDAGTESGLPLLTNGF